MFIDNPFIQDATATTQAPNDNSIKVATTAYVDNTATGFLEGSIIFADSNGNLAQDNDNFFWNNTTNKLGIRTKEPTAPFEVIGQVFTRDASFGGILVKQLGITADDHAIIGIKVEAGAGDPHLAFDVNGGSGFVIGIDNDDGDHLKIGQSNTNVGTNTYFDLSPNGDLGLCGVNKFFFDASEPQFRIGSSIGTFDGISIGQAANSDIRIGQGASNNVILGWKYNATVGNAFGILECFGGSNDIVMQNSGGNIGIGTPFSSSKQPTELLHISSTVSAGILLEADTDNSGEGDHPTLTLSQDGGAVTSLIGYKDSENNLFIDAVTGAFSDLILQTNSTNAIFIKGATQQVGISTSTIETNYILQGPNDSTKKFKANAFDNYSARWLKENLDPLPYVSDKLRKLTSYLFNYIGEQKRQIGHMADDVHQFWPEICALDDKGRPSGFDYGKLGPIIIKGWQESDERITKLERRQ